jgi:hypothetical protein
LSAGSAHASGIQFRGSAQAARGSALGTTTLISDTGSLPSSGGKREKILLSAEAAGVLQAGVASASTVGFGNKVVSSASIANLRLDVGGNLITARLLTSRAMAVQVSGTPMIDGDSLILGLRVNGKDIVVSGAPNQKIALPNGRILINQHFRADSASLTVIALRVMVDGVADILIARANAGLGGCTACPPVTCPGTPTCPKDDVITGTGIMASTKADFSLAVFVTAGLPSGEFVFSDPAAGIKLKSTSITKVTVLSEGKRIIEGKAKLNGSQDVLFAIEPTDNGEPGSLDTLKVAISTGFTASGNLQVGFIRVTKSCP